MALSNLDVIDAIGIDRYSGEIVLSLIDELDWSEPALHAELLSEKLNRYLGFVESREYLVQYPEAGGQPIRINLICRFQPPAAVVASLEGARAIAISYGSELSWQLHST